MRSRLNECAFHVISRGRRELLRTLSLGAATRVERAMAGVMPATGNHVQESRRDEIRTKAAGDTVEAVEYVDDRAGRTT